MKQNTRKLLQGMLGVCLTLGIVAGNAPIFAQDEMPFEPTSDEVPFEAEASDAQSASDEEAADMESMSKETDPAVWDQETEMIERELPLSDIETESADTSLRFTEPKTFKRSRSIEESLAAADGELDLESIPAGTPKWRDDRTIVKNTKAFPYYAVCRLMMEFEGKNGKVEEYVGTGYFISPQEILTCAHCLYDRPEESNLGEVDRIIVQPGRDTDHLWYGEYDSAKVKMSVAYPTRYTKTSENDSYNCDYGIIKINKPITDRGFIRLSTGVSTAPVHITGYPAVAYNKRDGLRQYEDWGTRCVVGKEVLETDTTGSGGQSGSPMLNKANEAVGIYGYGYSQGFIYTYDVQWGGGVRFTFDFLKMLDTVFKGDNSIEATVYRMYNPNSGEHVYTMNAAEVSNLIKAGWNYEGLAWRNAESKGRIPVYRLYNPNAGDHHYTSAVKERDHLKKVGWRDEGVIWYAPAASAAYSKVYRLYNPNAKAGAHHFTTDKNEYDHLVKVGWKGENKAFDAR